MRALALAGLAAAWLAGSCARHAPLAYPEPTDEDDPAARPDEPVGGPVAPEGGELGVVPSAGPYPVGRPELSAFLDRGPSSLFAAVEIRAAFADERFAGWEIVGFHPADPRFAAVDLAPGDVVTKVNGKAFQRPEEFFDLWESLRFVEEIRIEVRRADAPRVLVFPVRP